MAWHSLAQEKRHIAIVFIVIVVMFVTTAAVMELTTEVNAANSKDRVFSGVIPVDYTALSFDGSNEQHLKAIVKGSIYETGENMTVFGACFDGQNYLIPEANATFTAWYPNGSILLGPNASMDAITEDWQGLSPNGTGRWKIHVTMPDTLGTYFTELRCEYEDDWAIAFGEWQNPVWVERIGNISGDVINITNALETFRTNVSANFTQILQELDTIDTQNTQSVQEMTRLIHSLDYRRWVLDETNPFYILGSGEHEWSAVDMLSPSQVAVVSEDGYFSTWDGETWTELANTTLEWRGVSILPANTQYAWAVGTNGSAMYYSVNGGNATLFSGSGPSPGTALNDVVLFQDPDNPSGTWYGYLLDNNGQIYFTNTSGSVWTYVVTLDTAEHGRFSEIVANYGDDAEPEGFLVLAGQGSDYGVFDGTSTILGNVSGTIQDVSLLYPGIGYVIVNETNTTRIYRWQSPNNETLEYEIQDSNIQPTAIVAHATNNVWAATTDPSTFYHFDGENWVYSSFGYSEFVSVIISLGGNVSGQGVRDVAMFDASHGYAVGTDGLILVFESEQEDQLDAIQESLNNLSFNISLDINGTQVALESSLQELYNFTVAMNQSIQTDIDYLINFLQVMNASHELKLENILTNVTYGNLYMENTIFPYVNATYEFAVDILIQLGILEERINQTIVLQNQTLNIVNDTATDVEELVNRSRRFDAWVTP